MVIATTPALLAQVTPEEQKRRKNEEDRLACQAKGGRWDENTQTCILPEKEPVQEQKPTSEVKTPEVFREPGTERVGGVTIPGQSNGLFVSSPEGGRQVTPEEFQAAGGTLGRTFLGLSPEEVQTIVSGEQARVAQPEGTAVAGTAGQQSRLLNAGQILAQQIATSQGIDFTQLSPTDLSQTEAFTAGVVGAIPRALQYGATAAALGAAGGTAVAPGVGTVGGAVIGAAAGFVGGIASSIISNFKSQRTDDVNAQKRVLDEGKQNLNDWVTLAKSDPANRAYYLAQFNTQLAKIEQAHAQMKRDTQADVLKFETAVPDLAEFDAFFATGGERDFVINEMRAALTEVASSEYSLLELNNRYKQSQQ